MKAKIIVMASAIFSVAILIYLHSLIGLLTWLYFTFFIITLFVSIFFFFRRSKLKNNSLDELISPGQNAYFRVVKRQLFENILYLADNFFSAIGASFSWPTIAYFLVREYNYSATESYNGVQIFLKSLQLYAILYYAVFSVMLFIDYDFSLGNSSYLKILVFGALTCNIVLLLQLLLNNNLAKVIKGSPDSILLSLIIICLSLTISIVFLYLMIISNFDYRQLNRDSFGYLVNEFYKQKSLPFLWNGNYKKVNWLTFCLNISGLLFAATVIKTLKDVKSFKRDVSDMTDITERFLIAKKYDLALKWQLKIGKADWVHNHWSTYITILLALHRYDEAFDCFPKLYYEEKETSFAADQIFYSMVQTTSSYGLDVEVMAVLYLTWIKVCKSDGMLSMSINSSCLIMRGLYLIDFLEKDTSSLMRILNNYPLTYRLMKFKKGTEDFDSIKKYIVKNYIRKKISDFDYCAYFSIFNIYNINFYKRDFDGFEEDLTLLKIAIANLKETKDLFTLGIQLIPMSDNLKFFKSKYYSELESVINILQAKLSDSSEISLMLKYRSINFNS